MIWWQSIEYRRWCPAWIKSLTFCPSIRIKFCFISLFFSYCVENWNQGTRVFTGITQLLNCSQDLFSLLFLDRVLLSCPGWSWIHHTIKVVLELVVLLSQLLNNWDCRPVSLSPALVQHRKYSLLEQDVGAISRFSQLLVAITECLIHDNLFRK